MEGNNKRIRDEQATEAAKRQKSTGTANLAAPARTLLLSDPKALAILNSINDAFHGSAGSVRILTVGDQSSGKSSVLDHLAGDSPTGEGIVPVGEGTTTKAGIELVFVRGTPKGGMYEINYMGGDFHVFQHPQEVNDFVARKSAGLKLNYNIAFNLRITYPEALPITITDFPGPLQTEDHNALKGVLKSSYSVPNTVIIHVVRINPENPDVRAVTAIRVTAEEVAPGTRIIAVFTRLDSLVARVKKDIEGLEEQLSIAGRIEDSSERVKALEIARAKMDKYRKESPFVLFVSTAFEFMDDLQNPTYGDRRRHVDVALVQTGMKKDHFQTQTLEQQEEENVAYLRQFVKVGNTGDRQTKLLIGTAALRQELCQTSLECLSFETVTKTVEALEESKTLLEKRISAAESGAKSRALIGDVRVMFESRSKTETCALAVQTKIHEFFVGFFKDYFAKKEMPACVVPETTTGFYAISKETQHVNEGLAHATIFGEFFRALAKEVPRLIKVMTEVYNEHGGLAAVLLKHAGKPSFCSLVRKHVANFLQKSASNLENQLTTFMTYTGNCPFVNENAKPHKDYTGVLDQKNAVAKRLQVTVPVALAMLEPWAVISFTGSMVAHIPEALLTVPPEDLDNADAEDDIAIEKEHENLKRVKENHAILDEFRHTLGRKIEFRESCRKTDPWWRRLF